MEERLVSECCGEPDKQWNPVSAFYSDIYVCPKCGEDCNHIKESQREEEMKLEILTGKKDTNE